MEPRGQKRFARIVLLVAAACGAGWLAQLDFATKIPTDVLELIPRNERDPELALLRSLATDQQARIALFALDVPPITNETPAALAARRAAVRAAARQALLAGGAFTDVYDPADPALREGLGRYLFENRLDLLAPDWLARRRSEYEGTDHALAWPDWLAQQTVAALDDFLGTPEAVPFQELIPADPLLLVPGFVAQAGDLANPTATGNESTVLLWAHMNGPPLQPATQTAVFSAVDRARDAARAVEPGVTLRWTAISRFAAVSRARIKREMSVLNIVSLLAVLGIAALGVRRLPKVLHLAPVVGCALLGAWVITTLVFARVHLLVFVVGSLLGGVAIDYGFYLYLQPRHPGETYRHRVSRLIKPLLASALTTVLGFSLLLWSELPLIRQLGVFVSVGLLCALGGALLWFAQVDEPVLETRRWVRAHLPYDRTRWRWPPRAVLALGALIAVTGPWRLHWHDDIRELDIPSPELWANDRALRAEFGQAPNQSVYLTRGASAADARDALERFRAWHHQLHPDSALASLGFALPRPESWANLPDQLARLQDFIPALRRALKDKGYDEESFQPFFATWQAWSTRPARPAYDGLAHGLAATLHGPLSALLQNEPQQTWFAVIAPHPADVEPPAETATVSANQLESFNRLFSRYRISALHLSAIGLALVGASVFVLYGWRRGWRIFALPAGACLCCFGLFGWLGHTLNLFHLLGAFLGVCLSHNYAIFSAENAAAGEPPPPSIRFSGLTTAASFTVLAFSHIPVVGALGITVATIVVLSLVMVESGIVTSPRPVEPPG